MNLSANPSGTEDLCTATPHPYPLPTHTTTPQAQSTMLAPIKVKLQDGSLVGE